MTLIVLIVALVHVLFQRVLTEGNINQGISEQGLEKFSDCDVSIREQYGVIQSPGYPGKYPRYTRCTYTVHRWTPDTCEVKLTMLDRFEVAKMAFSNCSEDFFEVQNTNFRNGLRSAAQNKLCGTLPKGHKKFVFFPDNADRLIFKFQSTFHQKPGFKIEIKQLPVTCKTRTTEEATKPTHENMQTIPPCVQIISGRNGRITFPNFVDDNLPIEKCTFIIQKSESRSCIIQLDFSSFEVFESAGCQVDFLQLPTGQRLCGVLGGSRKLIQFPSDSDEVTLEFVATSQTENNFDIQVSQLPGPCEYGSASSYVTGLAYQQCDQIIQNKTERITSPGFPGLFGPNFKCVYKIFRPDPSVCQIELEFITFSLGKHNPPSCNTGAYLELPGKNRLCQDMEGKMILKVSEFKDPVVFYFQSDSQSSGRGFDIQLTQVPNTCPGYNVRPEIPSTHTRCFQEVSSYFGYFSSSHMRSTPAGTPSMCEFVVLRRDPTVCKIHLQISSRAFINVPCVNNFIHLPDGERICISVTGRREISIPKGSDYVTMVYYNTNNPDFNLFVDQIPYSCKKHNFERYISEKRRWEWSLPQ